MSAAATSEEPSVIRQVVPKAQFFEDIPTFVKESGKEVDDLLGEVQSTLQRYRHVEQQLQEKKMRLTVKKPEIEKCLDAINLLIEKRDGDEVVEVDFSLADQVYARAKVQKDAGYVGLWLGAGVMVEYGLVGFGWIWIERGGLVRCVLCVDSLARSLEGARSCGGWWRQEEAKGLLEEQLVSCDKQLEELEGDYGYVADQTTTTQVGIDLGDDVQWRPDALTRATRCFSLARLRLRGCTITVLSWPGRGRRSEGREDMFAHERRGLIRPQPRSRLMHRLGDLPRATSDPRHTLFSHLPSKLRLCAFTNLTYA